MFRATGPLTARYPWLTGPAIIGAPMRMLSGPKLALAISDAGGIGFIGPRANGEDWHAVLAETHRLLESAYADHSYASGSPSSTPARRSALAALKQPLTSLPVGIGFQVWTDSLGMAVEVTAKHKPCAVWLFAPANGQPQLDEWILEITAASPGTEIWLQVGTVSEAEAALSSARPPQVLVVQGSEAGGHGRAHDGVGLFALLPEIADLAGSANVDLIAAGGIADARGVLAALALQADGVAMGTRFLASAESGIPKGYQADIVRLRRAGETTKRTQLYNHLRGITNWPDAWSPRAIVNQTYRDHEAGIEFDELKTHHDMSAKITAKDGVSGYGDQGRLGAYVGTSVGLIHDVKSAREILDEIRGGLTGGFNRLETLVSPQ